MPPVIVRTPLSRRKVLLAAAAAAAVYAAANARAWLGTGKPDAPPTPAAAAMHLAVAVPVGSSQYQPHVNAPVLSAIESAIPEVTAAAGGRFTLDVMRVGQPDATTTSRGTGGAAATRPPQAHVLAPLLAAGAAPELLTFTEAHTPGWAPAELAIAARDIKLFPLDGHAAPPSDTAPAALDACRDNGALLALPLMGCPLVFGYDSAQLEQARIDPPGPGWTWQRVRDVAARLTRAATAPGESRSGAAYGFGPWYVSSLLLSMIWQHGGEVVSPDGTRSLLAEPAARGAIETFVGLVRGDGVSPQVAPPFVTYWTDGGILADGKWRVAMSPAVVTASFSPPLVDATDLYVKAGRAVAALLRGESVYGSHMKAPGGLALVELPSGPTGPAGPASQGEGGTGVPLGIGASIAVNARAKDPAVAAAALGALVERASERVPLPLRRQAPASLHATLQRFDRRVPYGTAEALAHSLDRARCLTLDSFERARRLHGALYGAVVTPLLGAAWQPSQATGLAERAAASVDAVLRQPR